VTKAKKATALILQSAVTLSPYQLVSRPDHVAGRYGWGCACDGCGVIRAGGAASGGTVG
jgi:hypothetical protein